MEMLLHSSATHPSPKLVTGNGFNGRKGPPSILSDGHSSSSLVPSASQKFPPGLRKSVIVWAKKSKNNNRDDSRGFMLRPDETTGPFPEALLLKRKKVQEDGRLLPDFADAEEEKLYESLNLQLQSRSKVEQMRHYEVVYLIHEKHAEEVGNVNEKVQGEVLCQNFLCNPVSKVIWSNKFHSISDSTFSSPCVLIMEYSHSLCPMWDDMRCHPHCSLSHENLKPFNLPHETGSC